MVFVSFGAPLSVSGLAKCDGGNAQLKNLQNPGQLEPKVDFVHALAPMEVDSLLHVAVSFFRPPYGGCRSLHKNGVTNWNKGEPQMFEKAGGGEGSEVAVAFLAGALTGVMGCVGSPLRPHVGFFFERSP